MNKVKRIIVIVFAVIILFFILRISNSNDDIPDHDKDVTEYQNETTDSMTDNISDDKTTYAQVELKECYIISDKNDVIVLSNPKVNTTDNQFEIMDEKENLIFKTGRISPNEQIEWHAAPYFEKGKTEVILKINSYIKTGDSVVNGNSFKINSIVDYI